MVMEITSGIWQPLAFGYFFQVWPSPEWLGLSQTRGFPCPAHGRVLVGFTLDFHLTLGMSRMIQARGYD